jgi:hypothetical protein
MWLEEQNKGYFCVSGMLCSFACHFGSFRGILDFSWRILGFFWLISWLIFLGHTSYNVVARAKKNVLSAFLVVSGESLGSFSCHFGSVRGIFGLFLA